MIRAVHTTVAALDDANRLAHAMVEQRLAACAQIEPIVSVYRWQGVVQQEPEFRIVFKTTREVCQALCDAIRDAHPYETPMILSVECLDVLPEYASWLRENTGP